MKAPTRIPYAEFPRTVGERCTFRDWIYLDGFYDGNAARLLFAPVPEMQGSAKAAPFVALDVTLEVGSGCYWTVSRAEYFGSLAELMRAAAMNALGQGGADSNEEKRLLLASARRRERDQKALAKLDFWRKGGAR